MSFILRKSRKHQALIVLARQVCQFTRFDGQIELRRHTEDVNGAA